MGWKETHTPLLTLMSVRSKQDTAGTRFAAIRWAALSVCAPRGTNLRQMAAPVSTSTSVRVGNTTAQLAVLTLWGRGLCLPV